MIVISYYKYVIKHSAYYFIDIDICLLKKIWISHVVIIVLVHVSTTVLID